MRSLVLEATIIACCVALLVGIGSPARADAEKVKVLILAGQSNMEGHGHIRSLDRLGEHTEYGHLLQKLKNDDGSWATREDVTIAWQSKDRKHGPLTVGWGVEDHEIGPELMFGTIMGEKHGAPVLLIKTAWGGKDVFCDFRSPSAGDLTEDEEALLQRERSEDNHREIGLYYRMMVEEINDWLANIGNVVPGYQGQGYELAGMAWFQGWNDFCQWPVRIDDRPVGDGIIDAYPHNLASMFRDLRVDLNAPDMPIAIGEMGVGGREIEARASDENDREAGAMMRFRAAQRAVAEDATLENVTFVPTADFWDTRLEELRAMSDAYGREKQEKGISSTEDNYLPTRALNEEYLSRGGHWYCHYNGSAATYSLVGYALAEALSKP